MPIAQVHQMSASDIVGDGQEMTLNLFEIGERKVFVTDIETPFPEGKLIVSTADKEGNITAVNKAFVFMSAWEHDELIGQPHSILRHPDMPRAAFVDIWQKLNAGEKWNGYVKNLRKDGGYYWTNTTILPNIRKGELVGYSSVRRRPSRKKIEETILLYKEMKNAEA